MDTSEKRIKILAQAIYEIRLLMTEQMGGSKENSPESIAGHLVYALHNEALAIIENRADDFGIEEALNKIDQVDQMFDANIIGRFRNLLINKK